MNADALRPGRLRARVSSALGGADLAARFGVDARALAALRIALASVLLVDLVLRARSLVAFYTDAGVLPRTVLAARYPTVSRLSLHSLSGAAWFQAALFVVAGAFALALLVGYRTRVVTLLSLLLLTSLQARNPLVLNTGDWLLRRLLVWGLLLPLGERWSLDAHRRERAARDRVTSLASAGLLVQVVAIYVANLFFKLRGEVWAEGLAVRYVFELEQFVVLFGEVLGQHPALLTAVTWFWLALLACAPAMLLSTGDRRTGLASLFVATHLGMLGTMMLGVFPLVSVCAILPFFPSSVWDAVETRIPDIGNVGERLSPHLGRPAFGPDGRYRRWGRTAATVAAAVLLVTVLFWNAASFGYVDAGIDGQLAPEERRWDMFAPTPPRSDGWVVAVGNRSGGGRVDAFHGGRVDWTPPDVSATYPSARWRKYLTKVWHGHPPLLHRFADYLCRRWHARHAGTLTSVSVYVVKRPSELGEPDPTRREKRIEHDCPGGETRGARG